MTYFQAIFVQLDFYKELKFMKHFTVWQLLQFTICMIHYIVLVNNGLTEYFAKQIRVKTSSDCLMARRAQSAAEYPDKILVCCVCVIRQELPQTLLPGTVP